MFATTASAAARGCATDTALERRARFALTKRAIAVAGRRGSRDTNTPFDIERGALVASDAPPIINARNGRRTSIRETTPEHSSGLRRFVADAPRLLAPPRSTTNRLRVLAGPFMNPTRAVLANRVAGEDRRQESRSNALIVVPGTCTIPLQLDRLG